MFAGGVKKNRNTGVYHFSKSIHLDFLFEKTYCVNVEETDSAKDEIRVRLGEREKEIVTP